MRSGRGGAMQPVGQAAKMVDGSATEKKCKVKRSAGCGGYWTVNCIKMDNASLLCSIVQK